MQLTRCSCSMHWICAYFSRANPARFILFGHCTQQQQHTEREHKSRECSSTCQINHEHRCSSLGAAAACIGYVHISHVQILHVSSYSGTAHSSSSIPSESINQESAAV